MSEKVCEETCPDCIEEGGICFVCWSFENDPDAFVMTEEQMRAADECADYIRKNKITPNLDHPEA
jgi:hypothetical protein